MEQVKRGLLVGAMALAVPLLAQLEGYSPKPYYDVANVLTDCYGNTKQVRTDHIRSKAECQALLSSEAGRVGMMLLNDPGINWDVPLLASGISFVYNVGDGAYRGSTYRQRLKQGRYYEACTVEMPKWKYITKRGRKVVSNGLVNRRAKETSVCLASPQAQQ